MELVSKIIKEAIYGILFLCSLTVQVSVVRFKGVSVLREYRYRNIPKKRQKPTTGVRLIEVSINKELTVYSIV